MSDDVKKIFSNFQIDKKNFKPHIDQLSKIKPDQHLMNTDNPVIKQNNTLIKKVNLRKLKSYQTPSNPVYIEENIPAKPSLQFILSGTQRTDNKKSIPLHSDHLDHLSSKVHYTHVDNSQASFINEINAAKIDVTGSRSELIHNTEQSKDRNTDVHNANTTSKPKGNNSSKNNLVYNYNQISQSVDRIKPNDTLKSKDESGNYDKNVQNIINQRKMVDMYINNTSTAVEEKLMYKQKHHIGFDTGLGLGKEGYNSKSDKQIKQQETVYKQEVSHDNHQNEINVNMNFKNSYIDNNEISNSKQDNKNMDSFIVEDSPGKAVFNKTSQKEDIRKKIDYDIGEAKNIPSRNNDQRDWLYMNPGKFERFDNQKQKTLTNFYKSRDQDNAIKGTKYLHDLYNEPNRNKINFESQTKEIKMSLFNNFNQQDKLNNMRDPITKELKPSADIKNVTSRFRDSTETGSHWFKNKAKPDRSGQFSEKFKSVTEICRTIPNY